MLLFSARVLELGGYVALTVLAVHDPPHFVAYGTIAVAIVMLHFSVKKEPKA